MSTVSSDCATVDCDGTTHCMPASTYTGRIIATSGCNFASVDCDVRTYYGGIRFPTTAYACPTVISRGSGHNLTTIDDDGTALPHTSRSRCPLQRYLMHLQILYRH